MGDLRTGQQLLDDFEADDRLTVRRMIARRHGSPALRRITAALADMCIRFEKRLSAVSAMKETGDDAATGYLHRPAAALDATMGQWRRPGPVGLFPEAEEWDGDAGEKQRRRQAGADLGPEPEPIGPEWPGPTKFSGRKLLCRRGRDGT